MPPRYAYWTILVDHQPTAFRAGAQEDLMPTFKRLKEKHPSAEMMWFQNGKLWNSRLDAQEAMRARGEMGRRGDERQGGFRDRNRTSARARPGGPERERAERRERREWAPKPANAHAPKTPRAEKLDWKPKGTFTAAPKRTERPEWKSKSARPQARGSERPERKTGTSQVDRTGRREPLDWKPKSATTADRKSDSGPAKRKWIPKEEYKRSKGIDVPRDSKWRPGGVHRDPRQKYKDAKKIKWTGFKKAIRTKWEAKQRKRNDEK